MKIKKIIKGIIGIGAVGGIAYAAYKLGENNGEVNKRFRQKYDDDEDEYDFDDDEDGYNLYDEPDDGCIAPANADKYNVDPVNITDICNPTGNKVTKSDVLKKYSSFDTISVTGVEYGNLRSTLLYFVIHKDVTRKFLVDHFDSNERTADKVIKEFEKAGYITKSSKGKYHCLLTPEEYCRLVE